MTEIGPGRLATLTPAAPGTVLSVFGIDPKRIGGTEYFARELSRQLAQRNWHSVLVFTREPDPVVRRFLSADNVTIATVPGVSTPHPEVCRALVRLLRRYRPAVTHLHYVSLLSPYPWLAAALGPARVFFTDHTSHPEGFRGDRRPLWKRGIARVLTLPLDGFVCVSHYGRQMAVQSGLPPTSRCHVVYNGVELHRQPPCADAGLQFRRRHAIPADKLVVLQVSWLIDDKGIPDLLTAAQIALQARLDLHFVIAGEGRERHNYERLSRSLGIDRNVTWTGLVRDPIGEGLYQAADILCQVSRWQEVFGWVITEAMRFEKPVVATRVGGIPEIVVDQITGLLVEPRAPQAVAQRVLQLAGDPDLRTRLGRAGQHRCRQLFDLRTNVAALIKLYGLSA